MNNMADLRIHNFGDTANGKVSGYIPNVHVNQVKWENINPAENLLDRLMAEKALELSKAKQDLDEQKFAYNAANDEVSRQFALKLQEMKNKNARDNLDYEYSLKNSYNNKIKAEEDLIQKEINKYYGYLQSLEDQGMDVSNPHFFTVARDNAKATGNTDILNFLNNNGIKEINKGLISVMETNIKYDLINDKFLNTDREIKCLGGR